MKAVSVSQMRGLDKRTINEREIPAEVLMERAGVGVAECILDYVATLAPNHVKRFVFLAGKGNNGGDAYVAARHISQHANVDVKIYSICQISELRGPAKLNAQRLPEEIEVEVREEITSDDFKLGDIIIDGLLGTGAKGPLKSPYDVWISVVNLLSLPVVALDIPSGLNGDDGTVASNAIVADLTISIALPKSGFILGKGPEYCGCLRCVDIGIPQEFIEPVKSDLCMVFEKDIRAFLGRVPVASHKNTRGRLLVIGGSGMYPGASFLSAEAALRAGAGLVYLAVPASVPVGIYRSRALILRGVADKGSGYFGLESLPELDMLASSVDAIVIGPGMSTEKCVYPIIEHFCNIQKPIIFDADALNMISKYPEGLMPGINSVLTPHPGEMARLLSGAELTGLISSDRITQARQLASKIGSTILLKGNRSITASPDGDVCVNCTGSPALATAGSGDVLAGIIGAFLAQGCDPMLAASAGAYLHGYAGEISEFGVRGTIADDLLYLIPHAMKELSPFA